MKNNPTNPNSAPKKEDPTTKSKDGLGEDELNKVKGGTKVPTTYLRYDFNEVK
jgi:hypothetical protein